MRDGISWASFIIKGISSQGLKIIQSSSIDNPWLQNLLLQLALPASNSNPSPCLSSTSSCHFWHQAFLSPSQLPTLGTWELQSARRIVPTLRSYSRLDRNLALEPVLMLHNSSLAPIPTFQRSVRGLTSIQWYLSISIQVKMILFANHVVVQQQRTIHVGRRQHEQWCW